METILTLAGILAVLAIGVISPGPSFLLVSRTAVAHSRRAAIACALGMGAGATVLSIIALVGLHAILQRVPIAYTALKLVGGTYLLYLAYKVWRGADTAIQFAERQERTTAGLLRYFGLGAATMISNPKAAVQYGVIFAAMLPSAPSLGLTLAIPPGVFVLEVTWYLIVACALSAKGPRNTYLRGKATIDRLAGAILGMLGIRLLIASK
jgi:threonine/homoserine/homoserine lactone efflux protein